MRILVTGAAGFIGYHVARRLLDDGHDVVGLDAITDYYDPAMKQARLALLAPSNRFRFHRFRLEAMENLARLFADDRPEIVIHLAAQAGVRYSLEHPRDYVETNIGGSFNLLECCRLNPVRHLMLASTSSIYGANRDLPFSERARADHPLTIYAASKKAMEEIAHCYAHLWRIPTTAFRFFTVYGPWGRPDMAPIKFMDRILAGETIDIHNNGHMRRDFTYVDDLVESVVRLIACVPGQTPAAPEDIETLSPAAPMRVVNIGGGRPVALLDFIAAIEAATGRQAKRNHLPMQPGELTETVADSRLLEALTGFRPATSIVDGVARLVAWRRSRPTA